MSSNKSKALFRNLGILTVSNFASKILVFLLVPLYTSVLSTEEYGIYDLVVSTVSLLVPILSLNIVDAVMRFMMDRDADRTQVATIGIRYVSFSAAAVGLVLLVLNRLSIWQQLQGLEIYIFLYYLFYVLNQYLIQLAKGLDRVKEMGIAGVAGTIVMIGANVLALLVLKLGLPGFFLANILAQAVPVVYFLFALHFPAYVTRSKPDRQLSRAMLLYCTPLIATVVGWWVNSSSDKYVVTFFCGVAVNGLLSVAYKIPSILNTIQSIFIQAWQISAIKEYGEADTAMFYGKTFCIINTLMCAACSWLILLTKPLAHLLYAKDFYAAWEFVPFLLLSSVLNCASGLLGPILSAKKDSRSMAMSAVYGAGINLVLNVALVLVLGPQGVTIATVIASFFIYQVRKNAVGKDITIEKYAAVLLTWGLLFVQAVVEVITRQWLLELPLMLIMLAINFSTLKSAIIQITVRKKK